MRLIVAIVLLSASFYSGWQVRAIVAQRDLQRIELNHAQQLIAAQQHARQREQVLQQQMEQLQDETQQQLAEITLAERTAADSRVRELAQTYAAGNRTGQHSPATDRCSAERKRAAMLAELFADLDQLAAGFAATADRNRISGLACQNAYEQARKAH